MSPPPDERSMMATILAIDEARQDEWWPAASWAMIDDIACACRHSRRIEPISRSSNLFCHRNVATPVDREYRSIEVFGRRPRHRPRPGHGSNSEGLVPSHMLRGADVRSILQSHAM